VPRLLPAGVRAVVAPVWAFLYPSGAEPALGIQVLYVLVPWIGVMMAGYGLGLILERDDVARRHTLLRIGLGTTAAFLVLATAVALLASRGGAGGEVAAGGAPLWMRVLNQQKYPASQLFLLMTLGPVLALVPWAEGAKGRLAEALTTFGRVPMFYYLAHLAAIHAAALVVNLVRTGAMHGEWYVTAPYAQVPPEQRWTLGLLYLVWAVVVAVVLYPACRWYARVKAERPAAWMRYI